MPQFLLNAVEISHVISDALCFVSDFMHRYQVVPRFKKTLQKRDIYRNIHSNCADNPVKWTTFNIELFVIYKGFSGPYEAKFEFPRHFRTRGEVERKFKFRFIGTFKPL